MARSNVTVNCVCPGPTDTPLLAQFLGGGDQGEKAYEGLKRSIPLKRLGQPDDLAGMVAELRPHHLACASHPDDHRAEERTSEPRGG